MIVRQRQTVIYLTCCTPSNTLPGQLTYGELLLRSSTTEKEPLLVEAPGQIVPNVWISHPMTGQEAVRGRSVKKMPLWVFLAIGPACSVTESLDREAERSKCCAVMVQIAVEI